MIAIINFGSKKTPAIAGMIQEAGTEAVIFQWDTTGREEIAGARGIVFSGSPTMFTATDPAPYFSRYDFVKEGKIPVLAICFGHQLLGLMHGAKIFRGQEVCATIPISVVKEDPLFNGLSPQTAMAEDHTEGITLPAGFIHLASSATYTIEGMRHPVLPLWGVQFHPEVSGANGQQLFRNFLELCAGQR